jgi:ubiquinone/menaquinone biosynthesis C-methylase UbiE
MIFFVLGALYFLIKGRQIGAAGFLSLAVGAKLLPLMFIPFVARRLGAKKFLVFSTFCLVFVAIVFLPLLGVKELQNIEESLKLYFQCFEFNGGLFRLLKHFFEPDNVWRLQKWFGRIVGAVIVLFLFLERDKSWKGLAVLWLSALGLYQFSAAAVHPWYITPLVALSILGVFRWPVLWGALLTLTYSFYYLPLFEQPAWALWTEYSILLLFVSYELVFKSRTSTLEDLMRRSKLFRSLYQRTLPRRLAIREERLAALLCPGEKLLDLGSGNGALCLALMNRGFDVTPVDVKDVSFVSDVKPLIYDGIRLPFADNSFDTALLITVLHHTKDPDALLKEASRVANKLIVMEDIHRSCLQKSFTQFTDSLVNMEFQGHPHTNRDDATWRETFRKMGKRVTHAEDFRTLLFFRQVIYVVE